MHSAGETGHALRGKVAVVTGAGRGIGRAIARRLSAAGANIAITSRTEKELSDTRSMIERAGGRVLAVPADVSNESDVERLFNEAQSVFGRIDILVNNAAALHISPIERMETARFDHLIEMNIRTIFLCCRAVWQIMADGGGGAIVNMSSMSAYDPFPGLAVYGATKAWVNAFTAALATEGAPRGIRLYGVAPGAVETQMLRGPYPDYPAEKTLQPDDVAALVESLLSPGCRYVSGQTLVIKKS